MTTKASWDSCESTVKATIVAIVVGLSRAVGLVKSRWKFVDIPYTIKKETSCNNFSSSEHLRALPLWDGFTEGTNCSSSRE